MWETTGGGRPGDLDRAEARRLVEAVREFGHPTMVFAGRDPFARGDLFELVAYSVELGLPTKIETLATAPGLTGEAIRRLHGLGVARMALLVGEWDRAWGPLFEAGGIGLETEVQTVVERGTLPHLGEICERVGEAGSVLWNLVFPVKGGYTPEEEDLTAEEFEGVFEELCRLSKTHRFAIQTTGAIHYRRYCAEKWAREESGGTGLAAWRAANASDGQGLLFVSHTGDIHPSGFLPVKAGNVRHDSLAEVYRQSPLFRVLRDGNVRHGKCGRCEFRNLCGGCRARSYAETGDYLAEDSRCIYQPVVAV